MSLITLFNAREARLDRREFCLLLRAKLRRPPSYEYEPHGEATPCSLQYEPESESEYEVLRTQRAEEAESEAAVEV